MLEVLQSLSVLQATGSAACPATTTPPGAMALAPLPPPAPALGPLAMLLPASDGVGLTLAIMPAVPPDPAALAT
jgi:hypothetical protein